MISFEEAIFDYAYGYGFAIQCGQYRNGVLLPNKDYKRRFSKHPPTIKERIRSRLLLKRWLLMRLNKPYGARFIPKRKRIK